MWGKGRKRRRGAHQGDWWMGLQHCQEATGCKQQGSGCAWRRWGPVQAGSQPRGVSGIAPAADRVGDTTPTPAHDNGRSDSLPAPSSGVATMVICVPGPEPGTGRVRAREGLVASDGTAQGGSGTLAPPGCGRGEGSRVSSSAHEPSCGRADPDGNPGWLPLPLPWSRLPRAPAGFHALWFPWSPEAVATETDCEDQPMSLELRPQLTSAIEARGGGGAQEDGHQDRAATSP